MRRLCHAVYPSFFRIDFEITAAASRRDSCVSDVKSCGGATALAKAKGGPGATKLPIRCDGDVQSLPKRLPEQLSRDVKKWPKGPPNHIRPSNV